MKIFHNITLAILFATLSLSHTGVHSQIDRSQAPEPGPAPLIELGDSKLLTLDNGLKLIVVENHKQPKISWTLSFEYAPIFEGNRAGMLELFGEMMRSGTTNKTKAELDEAVDFLGASISVSPKSIRGSGLTKHTNQVLQLMSEILFEPSFSENELERLRTQALSGLVAAESSPSEISDVLMRSLNYGDIHPYGEVTTPESINTLTRDDFVDFHNTYFHPNIATLVVVGDIDANTAYGKAQSFFGDWKRNGDIPYKRWEMPSRPQGNRVCFSPVDGAVQSVLKLTHTVTILPGSKDAIAVSVMNSILGGGAFSGRLMQNLREDKAFTYGARSNISTDPLLGSFTAYADVRNEVTDSAVVEFLYEIRRMTTEAVDSASFAVTKNYMTGSFARSLENPNTAARFALNIQRYNLPADYYLTYLEKLNAVTIEDVQRVAKNHLHPDQLYITCVGNKSVAESLAKFATNGTVEFFDAYGKPLIELSSAQDGVTAESVIKAHYKALGGIKAISKLSGVLRSGSMEMGGGMTLGFTHTASYKKNKRGARTSFTMSGQEVMTSVVNDNGGYTSQMGNRVATTDNELFSTQWEELDPLFLLHAGKNGINSVLLGVEEMNGSKYHVIQFTCCGSDDSNEAINMTGYFDLSSKTLSFTKSITEGEDGPMTVTTKFKNYFDLGEGFIFPMEIVTVAGTQTMAIRIGSISVNPEIDPSLFNLD